MTRTRRWAVAAALLAAAIGSTACERKEGGQGSGAPPAARIDPAERDLAERNERLAAQQRRDQPQAGGSQVSMVSGRIVELGAGEIVLKRDDGEEPNVVLVLKPDATITIGGQQAPATDLKEGMQVRAAFESVNDKEIAVRVEARP